MKITFEMKAQFFDRASVVNATDKATRKALSKAGAFIRTRARSSIKPSKKSSPPGKPPSSHRGDLKKIYFVYEPKAETVVIGPVYLRSGNVPNTLEFGGKSKVVSGRRGSRRVVRVATIAPRPFMGPALESERKNLPNRWAGQVRG